MTEQWTAVITLIIPGCAPSVTQHRVRDRQSGEDFGRDYCQGMHSMLTGENIKVHVMVTVTNALVPSC